ncbi:MAG TPA: MBL fold metallo-hydrolase [Acidimicrobiales bacterium]|nr:MBL fold metallo-hydrolase [Acidimicrobiales bacterium]
MNGSEHPAAPSRLYLRQLLAGRDFAAGDGLARRMVNFVYAIGDRETRDAVLVDPAHAPGELVEMLHADSMRLVGALLTHYHADHAGGVLGGARVAGVAELLEHADVPVHVQRDEAVWVTEQTGVDPSSLVGHGAGERLDVGGVALTLLHTPGHTPGSQCVLVDGRLVTGDTLFLEGCGRTDLPGGDAAALYESIVHGIAPLADETVVLPGHAYSRAPSATLRVVRELNPVLAPRPPEEWLAAFGG